MRLTRSLVHHACPFTNWVGVPQECTRRSVIFLHSGHTYEPCQSELGDTVDQGPGQAGQEDDESAAGWRGAALQQTRESADEQASGKRAGQARRRNPAQEPAATA